MIKILFIEILSLLIYFFLTTMRQNWETSMYQLLFKKILFKLKQALLIMRALRYGAMSHMDSIAIFGHLVA